MSRIAVAIALLLAAAGCSSSCLDCAFARVAIAEMEYGEIYAESLPEGDGCDDWRQATMTASQSLRSAPEPSDINRQLIEQLAFLEGVTFEEKMARRVADAEERLSLVEAAKEEACS